MTGGSKGMGLGLAEALVEEGHEVLTMQRHPGPHGHWANLDLVVDPDIVRARVTKALDDLGWKSIDALVLAGGMGAYMGWQDYDVRKHEDMLRVNYLGPRMVFHTCARKLMRRHETITCPECRPFWEAWEAKTDVAPSPKQKQALLDEVEGQFCWRCGNETTVRELTDPRGPSRVLWLGSTVVAPPGASGLEDYAGTKGALMGSIPSLARHYRKWGIRHIEYATSWVDTPMTDAIKAQNPRLYHEIIRYTPLGRMATIEESTASMMFLLTGPEYYHGCRVVMSGGAN